jgi:hypothetical protein
MTGRMAARGVVALVNLVLASAVAVTTADLVALAHLLFLSPLAQTCVAVRSAARRRALRERGLARISSADGGSDLPSDLSDGLRSQTHTGSSGGQTQPRPRPR